jgi:hypothetical protein
VRLILPTYRTPPAVLDVGGTATCCVFHLEPRHGRLYDVPASKEKAPAAPAMDAGVFVFYVVKNDSSTPTL